MITKEDEEGKMISTMSTTTSWSTRLKDPRIVRVSRAFGGKDRHSKVCTVKGLRDRRVRLSIPTAIQLYDLQDKLGLNQPSKVVEWLLKAAKNGIDQLPPLQLPITGNFPQNLYPMSSSSSAKPLKISNSTINWEQSKSSKSSKDQITEQETIIDDDKVQFIGDEEKGSSSFFSSSSNSMLYNSFHRWDTSHPLLSHDSTIRPAGEEFLHTYNLVPVPSGSQLVVYPPSGLMHSYFTSAAAPDHEFDHSKHTILSSTSQNSYTQPIDQPTNESVRPFHFSMMTNKDNDFRSR